MIIECIREGFHLAHRNWQLILLRLAVTIINFIAFFFFMGIPIYIGMVHLGMDITHAVDLLSQLLQDPFDFISKYLAILSLIIAAFIFYLIFSSVLFLYVLGGTLGILKSSAINREFRFTLSSFFKEARIHFSHLFWLLFLLLTGFVALLISLVISGVIGVSILRGLPETGALIHVFLTSFFGLSILVFGLLIFLSAIVFILFSVVASVVEGKGVVESIKKAFNLLTNKPETFLLYLLLLIGIFAANLTLLIVETPLGRMPVVITLTNMIFQNYLAVIFWGSLVAFYVRVTRPVGPITYDI
jgi:hypothetical protein